MLPNHLGIPHSFVINHSAQMANLTVRRAMQNPELCKMMRESGIRTVTVDDYHESCMNKVSGLFCENLVENKNKDI